MQHVGTHLVRRGEPMAGQLSCHFQRSRLARLDFRRRDKGGKIAAELLPLLSRVGSPAGDRSTARYCLHCRENPAAEPTVKVLAWALLMQRP